MIVTIYIILARELTKHLLVLEKQIIISESLNYTFQYCMKFKGRGTWKVFYQFIIINSMVNTGKWLDIYDQLCILEIFIPC